jgi:4-amino-4-deoxychorismate lyase
MSTWINGRRRSMLGQGDRGLHYGDGLFETMRVRNARIRLLELHLERLYAGLRRLSIPGPPPQQLRAELQTIAAGRREGVLKLIVTRGQGPTGQRPGYRPTGTERNTRIETLYGLPSGVRDADPDTAVRVRLCRTAVGMSPALAGLKSLNRLDSVLARSEWRDERIWEGLMADTEGHWLCGTMSNLFLRRDSLLTTPSIDRGGVAGVMRRWVLQTAHRLHLKTQEREVHWRDLANAEELFMTNAVVGIKSVRSLEGGKIPVRFEQFGTARQLRILLEAL